MKYSQLDNTEIRKISYETCPLKCTGSEALCNEMPVGQCRKNLSKLDVTNRVRFASVEVGQYFETEYKEKCLKTDEVRIITDESINFINMFNFSKNKLDRCESGQWVWIKEK